MLFTVANGGWGTCKEGGKEFSKKNQSLTSSVYLDSQHRIVTKKQNTNPRKKNLFTNPNGNEKTWTQTHIINTNYLILTEINHYSTTCKEECKECKRNCEE